MRRAGRRIARGAPARRPLGSLIYSLPIYSWAESDLYTVDGVSGKVASFIDKVPSGTGIRAITAAHAYAQATDANQVAIPAGDADYRGRVSANFAGGQKYASSSTAAAWKLLHDGTGVELWFVYKRTITGSQELMGTFTGARPGFRISSATAATTVTTHNDTAAIISQSSASDTAVAQAWRYSYVESGSPEFEIYRGATLNSSGSSGAAPSVADPSAVLNIGGRPSVAAYLTATWVSLMVFSRVLTTTERAQVSLYCLSKYGVVT